MYAIQIDGVNSSVIATLTLPQFPYCMTMNDDGSKLYVGLWAQDTNFPPDPYFELEHVHIIDTATFTETGTVVLPLLNNYIFTPDFPLNAPTHFRWSPDGTLLVFCMNDEVHRIDPATDRRVESMTTNFAAPLGCFALPNDKKRGEAVGERFLAGSGSQLNDGVAIITLPPYIPLCVRADLTDGKTPGKSDGVVDVKDLYVLLGNWNTAGPGADLVEPTDLVDVFDLFALLAAWGDCP